MPVIIIQLFNIFLIIRKERANKKQNTDYKVEKINMEEI